MAFIKQGPKQKIHFVTLLLTGWLNETELSETSLLELLRFGLLTTRHDSETEAKKKAKESVIIF